MRSGIVRGTDVERGAQRYDLSLAVPAAEVGMATGATIHTKAGLPVRLARRGAQVPAGGGV
mgnify:FL=1